MNDLFAVVLVLYLFTELVDKYVNCCVAAIDPCTSNPCLNGGTCRWEQQQQQPSSYVCTCPVGILGDRCEHGAYSAVCERILLC